MNHEPSTALVWIMSLIGVGVIYFVLFGQKRYNELMKIIIIRKFFFVLVISL